MEYQTSDLTDQQETSDDSAHKLTPAPEATQNLTTASVIGLGLALSACGGGGGGGSSGGVGVSPPAPPPVLISDQEAARFLLQAQFTANDLERSAVRSQGYAGWLNDQMAQPAPESGVEWLNSKNHFVPDATSNYFSRAFGDYMIFSQLMASPQQLRMRLSFALSEFFVVSFSAFGGFWPAYYIAGYWDVLTRNAFGNFRTLLDEVTLNPAMGRFLNTAGNLKEDVARGRVPDENYAREVMQLFTIGLSELNLDGTVKKDLLGNPIDSYSQSDITNLARVFTGYNNDNSLTVITNINGDRVPSTEFTFRPMVLNAANHSNLAVDFLGTNIPANTPALTALKTALDTLFNHPNVGPFFAKQMIQRLVTSNPSPSYVSRVAQVFNNNGAGVRGDLKAVWAAILTDVEARPASVSNSFGHLREPVVRLIQWARTFKVTSTTGQWRIGDLSRADNSLGQSPLRAPSVFNFFRPGYVPPQTNIATLNLVAPEFQIHNETSISGYMNFISNTIQRGFTDVKPDYTELMALAPDSTLLLSWLNLRLSGNQLSATTIATMKTALDANAVSATSTDATKLNRIYAAILMVMVAPEYLIQK